MDQAHWPMNASDFLVTSDHHHAHVAIGVQIGGIVFCAVLVIAFAILTVSTFRAMNGPGK
jgi:hypothetical protein